MKGGTLYKNDFTYKKKKFEHVQSQNQMSKLLQMSKDIVYCSADKLNFELNMQKRMTHWVLF